MTGKVLLIAAVLSVSSTLAFAQSAGGNAGNGGAAGSAAGAATGANQGGGLGVSNGPAATNGQLTNPGAPTTGTINRGAAGNDATNEPIRKCENAGADLSQPSRAGACQ